LLRKANGRETGWLGAVHMVLAPCTVGRVRCFAVLPWIVSPGASMPFFVAGHVEAFADFGGVPRVLLYDNLKSAVVERHGEAIRFQPTLLAMAAHYRFEPRPVAVARGNEKGRVERAIRCVRDAFFAARTFTDLADLNRQAAGWTATATSNTDTNDGLTMPDWSPSVSVPASTPASAAGAARPLASWCR
jgi:hypothetical protein